jgi:hypothetical protein
MSNMRRVKDYFEYGSILPVTLVASALIGFFAITGFAVIPTLSDPLADMRIEPISRAVTLDDTFTIRVVVEASVPVNVFAGELFFDNDTLEVESINYNTSIADLWAERPWYSNGEGRLNFAGGTTRSGGFLGTADLLTITFRAKGEGSGSLVIHDATILQHDGLGTDAPLEAPIDALFTIDDEETAPVENIIAKDDSGSSYRVISELPSTDLNGDGKQSVADISIFMLNIAGNDPRFDFNLDGKVDTKDLNLILSAE